MSSELRLEGVLEVKVPRESVGRNLWKVWREQWVRFIVTYPSDRGQPFLLLEIFRRSSEEPVKKVTILRDGLCFFRCNSKSRPYRTWAIMSANKPLMFFASASEVEAQDLMQSLRNSLWPPCFSFRMLTACTHEVSLIDDKNSFLSGLLGVYGRMVLSSNDVLSIMHPHWGATQLQIPLANIHGVHLVREAEVSPAGVFRIVLKGAEDLDFRMFQFYCNTARDAIQWILGKVIARDLQNSTHSRTKPVSLNNKTDLPTFPLYDSPLPKQSSEVVNIPNAVLMPSKTNYDHEDLKSEKVKNNFLSKTQSQKQLQEEILKEVQSTYLTMNSSATNRNIENILLHQCKICLSDSNDVLYENVKYENVTLESEQYTNMDVKLDCKNLKTEHVQNYFSSKTQSQKPLKEMATEAQTSDIVMNYLSKNQNFENDILLHQYKTDSSESNDILYENVKHENMALESEQSIGNDVKIDRKNLKTECVKNNFSSQTQSERTLQTEMLIEEQSTYLVMKNSATSQNFENNILRNQYKTDLSESNDILYENVKYKNMALESEQRTNTDVKNFASVPTVMNEFIELNNSDEILERSEYAMVGKKLDASEAYKQTLNIHAFATSFSEKNAFSEKRTVKGKENSECIDATSLVESCKPKSNVFTNGIEYAVVNKVHAPRNESNQALRNKSFDRDLKYKMINGNPAINPSSEFKLSMKTLEARKEKEQTQNSQTASIKSSILSIPCTTASKLTPKTHNWQETSLNVFQSNIAKNDSVSSEDILKLFDENCIETLELNNHVYEQVADRRGTIYEEIDESDDDDITQKSIPPPHLPAKPSKLEIPSSLRLQKLSQNITGVLQEMREPSSASKNSSPQIKLVKKIKDTSRIMHV